MIFKARKALDDETSKIDFTKLPDEVMREILVGINTNDSSNPTKLNPTKLNYYNAFVRYLTRLGGHISLSMPTADVLICLQQGLFSKWKELRIGALRSLRYFCDCRATVGIIFNLKLHYLIVRPTTMRSRLLSSSSTLSPSMLSDLSLLLRGVIAIADDGFEGKDKLFNICLSTICELAILDPEMTFELGGVTTILRAVQHFYGHPHINEALVEAILNFFNFPHSRSLVRADYDLEYMLAPFTDLQYVADEIDVKDRFKYVSCLHFLFVFVIFFI
ncbi:hypothetical protein HELRODRAFT_172490 [Helobdella robusta]|uniref:Rapamycin-insensitive companion of mTOR N-terminal domain-containing protein n=1 Tax=Helobdella robusta TaxID=6412 RepID=T1F5E2_HELRO|nr:hypothetical protein HELRODRAFT_172490 [Helobdella robusta]ESO04815.1 hypothetical protein HELRODRAFT_172490 [Helobdella robusta]